MDHCMLALDRGDLTLLALAAWVAVTVLARLMVVRRSQLAQQFRAEWDAERRRLQDAQRKQGEPEGSGRRPRAA
jgi:hypothetical protein